MRTAAEPGGAVGGEVDWMDVLVDCIDRDEVHNGARVGLRDAAIVVLLSVGLSVSEIASCMAHQVQQDKSSGELWITLRRGLRRSIIRLGYYRSGVLLEYLEEHGLWGSRSPLFRGRRGGSLTVSGVHKVRRKRGGRR